MLRIVVASLLLMIRQTESWSLMTTRTLHEGPPDPEILELAEIYDSQDEYRLNDPVVGLTALKDKTLESCFVNDFDPLWLPAPSDKRYIINSQPCEKVNKNTDLPTLRKKAGPKIASMCKDLYVFWLAARNMEPPPLPGVYQQESRHCEFDDDIPISNPLMELKEGDSTRSGSGLQAFPEVAPPMLPKGPDTNTKDGSAPAIQEKAPPMIVDGAPPKIGDGAPPMLRNDAQSMSSDGAPPLIGDIAPPMMQGGAAPMSHDGPPPMLNIDGPPPMIKDGEMAPPLAVNSHSRRDLDIAVPPMIKVQVTEKRPLPITLADMLKKMKEEKALNPVPTPNMKTPPPPKFRRYM